jgi:hypothetical protein
MMERVWDAARFNGASELAHLISFPDLYNRVINIFTPTSVKHDFGEHPSHWAITSIFVHIVFWVSLVKNIFSIFNDQTNEL